MAAIPLDLIPDVLLCLPVKSLLRFRCLSSRYRTLIGSPHFVQNHLKRSIQTNTHQKLIIRTSTTDFYAADFDDGLRHAFPLNNPLRSPGRHTIVCGCCNGLILLGITRQEDRMDFAIWNPFTRRYKILPICPAQRRRWYNEVSGVGFGYDPTHDDYKAVMFYKVNESKQVWVFSLESFSWKRIKNLHQGNDDEIDAWVAIFADGALCWNTEENNFFVGFDLSKEVFFEFPLLPDLGGWFYYTELRGFGGRICFPVRDDERETIEGHCYVPDEGGEVWYGSWRMEFRVEGKENIGEGPFFALPLAYSGEGDRILLTKNNHLFWYNLENRTGARVEIAGLPEVNAYNYHVYRESLVSLGNGSAFDGAIGA